MSMTAPRYHSVLDSKKRCILCKQRKTVESFDEYSYTTNQGKRSKRLNSRCRPCDKQRRQQRHSQNKERENSKSRAYHASHRTQARAYRAANIEAIRRSRVRSEQRRRAAKAVPKELERYAIAEALEMYRIGNQYIDVYDGTLIDKPTIDHVVPLSRGGNHTVGNLAPTAYANNSSKQALPMLIWMAKRAREARWQQ